MLSLSFWVTLLFAILFAMAAMDVTGQCYVDPCSAESPAVTGGVSFVTALAAFLFVAQVRRGQHARGARRTAVSAVSLGARRETEGKQAGAMRTVPKRAVVTPQNEVGDRRQTRRKGGGSMLCGRSAGWEKVQRPSPLLWFYRAVLFVFALCGFHFLLPKPGRVDGEFFLSERRHTLGRLGTNPHFSNTPDPPGSPVSAVLPPRRRGCITRRPTYTEREEGAQGR